MHIDGDMGPVSIDAVDGTEDLQVGKVWAWVLGVTRMVTGRVAHRYGMGTGGPTHTHTHETHTCSGFYPYPHHKPMVFCNTVGYP